MKQPFDDENEPSTVVTVVEKQTELPPTNAIEKVDRPEEVNVDDTPPVLRTGGEGKVDYTGAQVWKVSTQRISVRGVISRLSRRNCKITIYLSHLSLFK